MSGLWPQSWLGHPLYRTHVHVTVPSTQPRGVEDSYYTKEDERKALTNNSYSYYCDWVVITTDNKNVHMWKNRKMRPLLATLWPL